MPGLAAYKRILSANQRSTIVARGTTVFLRNATGDLNVTVRSNAVGTKTGAAYTVTMSAAEKWFHAEEFDQVEIEDASGAQNTIEFYIGFGDFEKPVPDIINVQLTSGAAGSVETIADKVNIDIGNAGKEELLPADSTRIQAYITALDTNAEVIRIGDTNVTATRGTPVAAGDSLLWTSKAACFACSIATNDQSAALTVFKE